MRSLVLLLALTFAAPAAASSCEEWRSLSRDEARELMSVMVAPEADPLDQLFAFEDVICADQPVLRMMALRTGASARSEAVRSQILLRALFEKRVLRIDLGEGEPVREQDARYVEPVPVLEFDVQFRDPQAGCLSFHGNQKATSCTQNSIAQVFGTTLTLKINGWGKKLSGEFHYDHGDTVTGEIHMNRGIYPATIQLF